MIILVLKSNDWSQDVEWTYVCLWVSICLNSNSVMCWNTQNQLIYDMYGSSSIIFDYTGTQVQRLITRCWMDVRTSMRFNALNSNSMVCFNIHNQLIYMICCMDLQLELMSNSMMSIIIWCVLVYIRIFNCNDWRRRCWWMEVRLRPSDLCNDLNLNSMMNMNTWCIYRLRMSIFN